MRVTQIAKVQFRHAGSSGDYFSGARLGMTMVELLVVLAIVAAIAVLSIGALMTIPEHARNRGTEALLAKIDSKLVQKLDQFNRRHDSIRRLPCDDWLESAVSPPTNPMRAQVIAVTRAFRQEFPEWFNVDCGTTPPTVVGQWSLIQVQGQFLVSPPVVFPAAYYQTATEAPSAAAAHASYVERSRLDSSRSICRHIPATTRAECLYMIVTSDGTDTAEFAPTEIADTDDDGLPEFVDKWRNPIQFFLWPTHYTSARQNPGSEINPDDPNQLLTENRSATSWWQTSRGPFERLFFSLSSLAPTPTPQASRTYPLIISAGSDSGFGLVYFGPGVDGQTGTFDDIATTDKRAIRITNSAQDGYGMDVDNIDNHGLRPR